jgi:DNA polymerase epsilon subunit 1
MLEGQPRSAVNLYFIKQDGKRFQVTMKYQPYFYVKAFAGAEEQVARFLQNFNKGRSLPLVEEVSIEEKEDLDLVLFRHFLSVLDSLRFTFT